MKKNSFTLFSVFQRYISLETVTFLAALGYGLAIMLLCILR